MGLFNKDMLENNSASVAAESEKKNIQWKKYFRIFLYRVPLWIIAPIVIVYFGWVGVQNVTTEKPTDLRPIILDAPAVDVTVTMCNEKVDELNLNIREEEKRLENRYEDVENVENARVRIEREDCEKEQ
jgi:hypothetical protein